MSRPFGLSIFAVSALTLLVLTESGTAQVMPLNNETSTPVQGVGHDYVKLLSETVNPANGSLSIRINLPVPSGRGITLPLSIAYDSTSAIFFAPGTSFQVLCELRNPDGSCAAGYSQIIENLFGTYRAINPQTTGTQTPLWSLGGWKYTVPYIGFNATNLQVPISCSQDPVSGVVTCTPPTNQGCVAQYGDYMFYDAEGSTHQLNIGYIAGPNCPAPAFIEGGDPQYTGYDDFRASNPYLVTIADASGTVFSAQTYPYFNSNTPQGSVFSNFFPVTSVEDANGNLVTLVNGTATDSLHRQEYSISSIGGSTTSPGTGTDTISVAGISTPFSVQWAIVAPTGALSNTVAPPAGSTSPALQNGTPYTCMNSSTGTNSNIPLPSQGAIQSISLPNGQSYRFEYDSVYGTISKIIYPDGGYVRYVWGPNPSSEVSDLGLGACMGFHDTLAVQDRFVSYDGVSEVLHQHFTYSPTGWKSPDPGTGFIYGWGSKGTTVTATDAITSLVTTTTYSYVPTVPPIAPYTSIDTGIAQIAVESSIDYSGLETVTEGWSNTYNLLCKITTINGSSSGEFYTYAGSTQIESGQLSGGAPSTIENTPYGQLTDQKEFDWGQVSPSNCSQLPALPAAIPLRETAYNYQAFGKIPTFAGDSAIADKPSSVVLYGGGAEAAETDYSYDGQSVSNGQPVTSGERLTPASATQHDEGNYGSSSTAPRGNITTIKRRCLQGCPDSVIQYGYDETGQPAWMIDQNNNKTSYSFIDSPSGGNPAGNSNAYLTQITYPSVNGITNTLNYQYNYETGLLGEAIDENSQITNYTYDDPLQRITEVQGPPDPYDGGQRPTTTYSYYDPIPGSGSQHPTITASEMICNSISNAAPAPACPSSSLSKNAVTVMDGMRRPIQNQLTSDPYGATYQDTVYDGMGNVYTSSNPYRSISDSTYGLTEVLHDALGRISKRTDAYGYSQNWNYGANSSGSFSIFTDEDGNEWQRFSDGLGRLTKVLEPTGGGQAPSMPTSYTYDALNNLLSVDQLGDGSSPPRQRSFMYDGLGRLTTAMNPESGTINYYYLNASGGTCSGDIAAVCRKTDARAITTSFSYDSLNRLTSKTYSDATPAVTYSYDTSSESGAANTVGRLTGEQVTYGSSGSLQDSRYIYDPEGHLLNERERRVTPGSGAAVSPSFAFTFDLAGDLTSSTDGIPISGVPTPGHTSPIQLSDSYDAAARLTSIVSNWNGGSSDPKHPGTLFQVNSYGAMGMTSAAYGINTSNGVEAVSLTRGYDKRSRLISETDTAPEMVTASATASSANVTISGSEQVSAYSSGSITFSGSEQCSGGICDGGQFYIAIGSSQPILLIYSQNSTPASLATNLASLLNSCTNNGVQALAGGNTVYIQSCVAGTNTEYAITAIPDGHSSQFAQYSFTVSTSGPAMAPILTPTTGTNAITFSGTEQSGQTGNYVVFVFSSSGGPPVANGSVYWGSGSTPASLASALAVSIGSCSTSGNTVGATAAGATVFIAGCQSGNSYTLQIELNYYSSGSGPDFTAIGSTTPLTTVAFSGAEQGGQTGGLLVFVYEGQNPPTVYTINYGSTSTSSTLAANLVSSMGTCSSNGNLMTGLASGGTVYMIPCQTSQPYSVSAQLAGCSCSQNNGPDFSVVATSAGPALPGVPGASYDTGTVTLNVNGTQVASVSYGSNSTPSSIASALASAGAANSVATLQANGAGLTITSKTLGDDTEYAYSISTSSSFSTPSFSASPASGSLTGGTNATTQSEVAYQYCLTAGANCSATTGGFDAAGNLLSVYDSVMGSWSYTPDHLNRLSTGSATSGPYAPVGLSWTYDGFGNRWGQTVSRSPSSGMPFPQSWIAYPDSAGNDSRISSTSNSGAQWAYDGAGNVTFDGSNYYAYDAEERLCAVESTATGGPAYTGYLYDGDGNRIAKGSINSLNCNLATNGFTLKASYVRDAGNQESEWNGAGQWQHTNVYAGSSLLATYSFANNDTYFALSDWLGTKRAEITPDGCLEVYFSLPYGDNLTPAGNCLDATEQHFTGKERDTESGNDYFKYRYYASTMGRWLSPDPSMFTHVDFGNPQSLNLYNYVGNRPLTLTDLDGLCWKGFQWACNVIQRFENRFSGFGFQTDDQILRNPNQRSQKKLEQKREESHRKEIQPQSLLTNSAYQVSGFVPVHTTTVVVPIDGVPVPVPIFSVGVTTSVTWIPKTNTWCVGPSATLASGGGKAFSATMYGSTDAQYTKDVISGWGATLNAQPSELGGISVSSNSSGVLTGYTIATDAGLSGAWGYTKCADF